MNDRRQILALCLVLSLGGILTGWQLRDAWNASASHQPRPHAVRQGGYQFINPLLMCSRPEESFEDSGIESFKRKVEDLIAQRTAGQKVKEVAVYFRDHNDGASFYIQGDIDFSPASLMKVPLMMAYLKEAEANPQLLNREFEFKRGEMDLNTRETIKPSKAIEQGKHYTVGELIEMMIIYSDNNAWRVLINNVAKERLETILSDLHIQIDDDNGTKKENFLSVKEYASFFRVLYNATYLTKDSSEKALEILTRTEFRGGIVAGLPLNIIAAHKFGERVIGLGAEKQLHDCGIVYYPGNPYLLCVMTRGSRFSDLAASIRDVSKLVFREFDARHRNL